MKITDDQVDVLNDLMNLLIKLVLVISSIAAFWYVLIHLLDAKGSIQPIVLAALDTMLAGTIYYIVAHYFPSFKIRSERKSKKRDKPKDN
jgi:hypothetical protein